MNDVVDATIGDNPDGVAVGQGIRQRIRRNSHNVNLNLYDSLSTLQGDLIQLQMDIKLLHNMAQERREQVNRIQDKVDALGATLLLMGVASLIMAGCFAFFVIMVWR